MSEIGRYPRLGSLADRVALQKDAASPAFATVWSSVRKLQTGWSVTLRFRTDVQPGAVVIYRGKWMRVVTVTDINGRGAYIALICEESPQ